MDSKERAKYYGEQILNLAELIVEYLEEEDFDHAGALNIDLQEWTAKLDKITDELLFP